jgi:hypothetical protein
MINRLKAIAVISMCYIGWIAAQPSSVPTTHEVYEFLKTMESKQLLVGYRDAVKPFSRNQVAAYLLKLQDAVSGMTDVQREEFEFLKSEFATSIQLLFPDSLKLDPRWHLINIPLYDGNLFADLNLRFGRLQSQDDYVNYRSNGFLTYGSIFKNFGFYFNFADNRDAGTIINSQRIHTPLQGIPFESINTANAIEYTLADVQVAYRIGKAEIAFEKRENDWGLGYNGNTIFSRKAPSFPQVRLYLPLTDWIDFTYIHGELNSRIIDSTRSYMTSNSPTDNILRPVYRDKYIAAHMFELTPIDGLDISFGESVVYSDRSPQLLYMIPIMFFKVGEHYNSDTDNCQFFGTLDVNLIKGFNFNFTIFIDELSLYDLFNPVEVRNQHGYTIGFRTYDLGIDNLRFLFEYTKINPYVYAHRYEATAYTNAGFDMGHWIGQNADNLVVDVQYKPLRSLTLGGTYESYRKGGTRDIALFYNHIHQPFLFGPIHREYSIGLYGSYQFFRDAFAEFKARSFHVTDDALPALAHENKPEITFMLRYGIW